MSSKPFFYGRSDGTLTAKGQVAMPARFRAMVDEEILKQGFVLMNGRESCVYIYTHQQFREIQERIRTVAEREFGAKPEGTEFFRRFMESAYPIELDSQGRFVIPAILRETCKVCGPEVVFIGVDNRIEIWDPKGRNDIVGNDEEYQKIRKHFSAEIFGL